MIMEENEKQEDIRESVKLESQFTEDENQFLIGEDGNLVAKLSFYNEEYHFSKSEKNLIGNVLLSEIAEVIYNSKEKRKQRSWDTRSEAFKQALRYEKDQDKQSMTWLMTSILEISEEDARKRFYIFNDLKSLKDFENLKDDLLDKVILNSSHLKDCELGDVELIRTN
jgi:hypothetical protein